MKKWIVLLLAGTFLLGGCAGTQVLEPGSAEAPAEIPSVVGDEVVAEAAIEPAYWSELRFEIAGTVAEVLIEPGDTVEAGDVLVRLDATEAQLAVQEAESALASAEAELALLRAGPRAEEIAAAENDLEAAEAALTQATAQRDQLTGGATEADIAAAEAEVSAAESEWLRARDERDDVYKRTDDKIERENVDYRFHAAREALAAAQAKLEAQRNVADERIREAEAGVQSAVAQRDVAQAELDLLKAGNASWEIAAAEAGVQQAEAALAAANVALDQTILRAPFSGTVTKVYVEVGNMVAPGERVAVLAALDQLQARTFDLTELDVARVAKGQLATVTVDALPNEEFAGVVQKVALRPEEYRGDVVYDVVVDVTDVDGAPLRWGMTALVEIKTD